MGLDLPPIPSMSAVRRHAQRPSPLPGRRGVVVVRCSTSPAQEFAPPASVSRRWLVVGASTAAAAAVGANFAGVTSFLLAEPESDVKRRHDDRGRVSQASSSSIYFVSVPLHGAGELFPRLPWTPLPRHSSASAVSQSSHSCCVLGCGLRPSHAGDPPWLLCCLVVLFFRVSTIGLSEPAVLFRAAYISFCIRLWSLSSFCWCFE